MGLGSRVLFDPQQALAAGSVGASYTKIGTPLAHPSLFVLCINGTDAAVQISLDGTNDHFPLLAGASFTFDVSSDKVSERGLFISQGTQFYAKQIGTPTTGSLYICPAYSKES